MPAAASGLLGLPPGRVFHVAPALPTAVAPSITVERCTFQDNGQIGSGTDGADRLRLTDCLARDNDTKGFSRAWE